MNRNIDEYASAFQRDPGNRHSRSRAVRGWVYSLDKLRRHAPEDWRELKDGIHELHGTDRRAAFAYKLAVRKTPTHGSSWPTT
jgi:hypothetical protein